jgi:heptosyltransferase-2
MGQKILVRTPNHLGDCVMALPMINEVQEAHPGSSVTLLVPEALADLFGANPAIDAIIRIPTAHVHGMIAVMKIKELVSSGGFDLCYILPPSFGAAAAFKLAGIKERIGYIADGRRLLLSRAFALPAPLNCQHRSRTYFDLLRRATSQDIEFQEPKLVLNDADDTKAEEILAGYGVAASDRYAVISHRAVAESRRWGTQNYTELARRMVHGFNLKIILIGSNADSRDGDEVVAGVGGKHVLNLAGKTSLRESAAILANAVVFIGNDSGPAHLAAAVGIPLVVISGADDPKETGPLSRRSRLLYLSQLECISCVRNKCSLKGQAFMRCMHEISADMVFTAVRELLFEQGVPA